MKRTVLGVLLALSFTLILPVGSENLRAATTEPERDAAVKFLRQKTGRGDFNLVLKLDLGDLKAYTDPASRVYVIVADKQYHRYLDSPILAYSTENAIRQSEITGGTMLEYFFGEYSKALQAIKKSRRKYTSKDSFSPSVEPFMGVNLGQYDPYNQTFPEYKGKRMIAGCGAVALTQVLLHDVIERQAVGVGTYTMPDGKKYTVDLSRNPVGWDNMSVRDTSLLLFKAALSVGSVLGDEATSSSLSNFRKAIVETWGYSPRCRFIQNRPLGEILSFMSAELSKSRPVIVGGKGHSFVCDGQRDDFLHYNFGWTGNFDGWFRTLPSATLPGSPVLPFSEVVIYIYPEPSAGGPLEVTLERPGQLDSLLSEEQKLSTTTLIVSGPIGGDDMRVIRRMAGAADYGCEALDTGSLTEVDLSGATFEGAGEEFCTFGADDMHVWGTRTRGGETYKFDFVFKDISDAQWEEFCEHRGNVSSTRHYARTPDGHYTVSYLMQENAVPDYLFLRCKVLRSVILPSGLASVSEKAFEDGVTYTVAP